MPQKRDFYRIPFPISERPRLIIGAVDLEVLDISECGVKVALPREAAFGGSGPHAATVQFKDGTTTQTTAVVNRRESDHLILRFLTKLPYSAIVTEQQRLLRMFGREALQPNAQLA